MFDKHDTDRLIAWKEFRNTLETSETPFEDVAEFWSRAPFVSAYLNPFKPSSWPDPWHLVLDNRLDELAITIGTMYTLKLTERFKDADYQIYRVTISGERAPRYPLIINNNQVLNFEYNAIVSTNVFDNLEFNIIWPQ